MQYVLWEISYSNLTMLMAVIPRMKDEPKEEIKEAKDTSELKELLGL